MLGGVQISTVADVAEFAALADPVLAADPARNTIPLTVLDGARRDAAPLALKLVVREAGEVVGVALRSPGRPLLVSALPPDGVEHLAAAVVDADPDVPGVTGPVGEAEQLARALAARTGARLAVATRSRLFELGDLVEPTGVPGRARVARAADVALLSRWREAFAVEAHEGAMTPEDAEESVRRALRLGGAEVLWEVDGAAVSQASARPVLAGTSRIGPVYTPPEHRRHGYAAAVTAAASRWALDAGAERVLLFTDLANPTTNALYPRIGYRPLHDTVDLDLVHD
jgi:GNAT superfamily N-acetyltransferase